MVCEALMMLDKEGGEKQHGHGLATIKKAVEDKYKLHAGWEKRLTHVIKMMVDKHQLDHMPGHIQTYTMAHNMKEKMEHKEEHKAKAPKKKMTKAKSPAVKAKKADTTKAKKPIVEDA